MKLSKKHYCLLTITSLIILLPTLVGIYFWKQLPERIATHFSFSGEPDGWSSKFFAVFGIYFILLVIHLICSLVTLSDPKRKNINGRIYQIVLFICPFCACCCGALVYSNALGFSPNINVLGNLFCAALFLIVGNYLPKTKQNYTVGIKLPWTLHDSDNWNRTHRFAGWLWVLGGILILCNIFFQIPFVLYAVFIAAIFLPTLYSFILYRKKQNTL